MTDTLIRYNFEEFSKFKEINDVMPQELQKHCIINNNCNIKIRDEFKEELIVVIDAMMKGMNPNNIMVKNTIREHLNKLTKENYSIILEQLETIQYTTDILTTLATELIIRSMNDYVSAKGFENNNEITFTDIYTDIIVIFTNKNDKFGNIIRNLSKNYFDDFIDPTNSLDKNNLYRVDNFKGFMNLIGLLYRKKIMGGKVINYCLNSLQALILNEKKTIEEVQNIFMAYERLLNQILLSPDIKQYIEQIKLIHNKLIENENKNRFKKFALVTHDKILEKINLIN